MRDPEGALEAAALEGPGALEDVLLVFGAVKLGLRHHGPAVNRATHTIQGIPKESTPKHSRCESLQPVAAELRN